MSEKNTESSSTSEEKSDQGDSSTGKTSLFGSNPPSTPSRLFGQFKQNGSGFSSFGQFSSNPPNESNSSSSYFTSAIAKLSSNSNSSTGFGASPTPLAASLAPLSANKEVFGATKETKNDDSKDQPSDEEEDEQTGDQDDDDDEQNQSTASLLEKAAEYEAKRASTHPLATIQGDTSTGEENEVTKFQMAGKLFMYNSERRQFVERGYGVLKVNERHDPEEPGKLHARIIMRLDKAFRVILNSPIFAKMTVERVTDRSVRFGAQDENHLRVFIIKASTNDCNNLCKELQSRIQIIESQQTASNKDSPTPSTRILKRAHSKSDSDPTEDSNDLTKKSKVLQGYRDGDKQSDEDDDDDAESEESTKAGEQESGSTP